MCSWDTYKTCFYYYLICLFIISPRYYIQYSSHPFFISWGEKGRICWNLMKFLYTCSNERSLEIFACVCRGHRTWDGGTCTVTTSKPLLRYKLPYLFMWRFFACSQPNSTAKGRRSLSVLFSAERSSMVLSSVFTVRGGSPDCHRNWAKLTTCGEK